ncbi:MAG: cation:proton antiporter [Campylobacterales bacterium]|nr:cation:proton antiporter [Campylobacterales bacterium]
MNTYSELIISIGFIFFLGLGADFLAKRISIPRVTILIVIGIVIGPSAANLLPEVFINEWFHVITSIALGMVGFLIGHQFTYDELKKSGKVVFSIALGKVLLSFILIAVVLVSIGLPLPVAFILASIASATAPAAVYEVVSELNIKNSFSTTLISIVALDDILAMFLFSLVLAIINASGQSGLHMVFASGVVEIFGSLFLGYAFGYPIAKINGRIQPGEPSMVEALGSVFLITGIAQYLELSPILATMAMGSAVSTFATHHTRALHAIENIQWPFMIMFFLLAGASLELETISDIGVIGLFYIVARIVGFYFGARLGAKVSGSEKNIERWIGLALIPQA